MAITLKAARVNCGLTQVEAAEKLGISAQTLIKYERGKVMPKVKLLPKLEEVYGVKYSDLIFVSEG